MTAKYQRAKNLLEADIAEEIVALDPDGGSCFGFNEVATSVWRLLDQPKSFEQLCQGLMQEYDVGREECSSDLKELLADLEARGLIYGVV